MFKQNEWWNRGTFRDSQENVNYSKDPAGKRDFKDYINRDLEKKNTIIIFSFIVY